LARLMKTRLRTSFHHSKGEEGPTRLTTTAVLLPLWLYFIFMTNTLFCFFFCHLCYLLLLLLLFSSAFF
jgi:hypothetical protein